MTRKASIRSIRKKISLSDKKFIMAGLVIFALLYLAVLPPVLTASYEKTAPKSLDRVEQKMDAVFASFDAGAFTKNRGDSSEEFASYAAYKTWAESVYSAEKRELADADRTVAEAQETLDSEEGDLTIAKLPLLTWHAGYQKAVDTSKKAEKYVSDSKTYLTDYKSSIGYLQEYTELGRKEDLATAKVTEDYFALPEGDFEAYLRNLEDEQRIGKPFNAKFTALKPPTPLKEFHATLIRVQKEYNTQLSGLIAALKANDLATAETLFASEEELEADDRRFQQVLTNFHQKSSLRKQINSLERQANQLSELLSA